MPIGQPRWTEPRSCDRGNLQDCTAPPDRSTTRCDSEDGELPGPGASKGFWAFYHRVETDIVPVPLCPSAGEGVDHRAVTGLAPEQPL